MEFTYRWYQSLLKQISQHGYQIVGYRNWQKAERCAILRHDIDCDIDKAVRLAEVESSGG